MLWPVFLKTNLIDPLCPSHFTCDAYIMKEEPNKITDTIPLNKTSRMDGGVSLEWETQFGESVHGE